MTTTATPTANPFNPADKHALRTLTRAMYDFQKLRIGEGNRIVRHFYAKLGQEPGQRLEDALDKESLNLLEGLREEYSRIATAVAETRPARWAHLVQDEQGLLTSPYEVALMRSYLAMEHEEQLMLRDIEAMVKTFALWRDFLVGVRGVGPLMAAVIISEFDPHKSRHVSSFWAYCGLDVAPDGRGRSRRAEHLVERTYTKADGSEGTRMGITFNPFLKTKLIGVLGASFLRSGSEYAAIYHDYKHRMEHHAQYGIAAEQQREADRAARLAERARLIREGLAADLATKQAEEMYPDRYPHASKIARHNKSIRYMVKMFLKDLWINWCLLEGLDPGLSYAEAKLGLTHSA